MAIGSSQVPGGGGGKPSAFKPGSKVASGPAPESSGPLSKPQEQALTSVRKSQVSRLQAAIGGLLGESETEQEPDDAAPRQEKQAEAPTRKTPPPVQMADYNEVLLDEAEESHAEDVEDEAAEFAAEENADELAEDLLKISGDKGEEQQKRRRQQLQEEEEEEVQEVEEISGVKASSTTKLDSTSLSSKSIAATEATSAAMSQQSALQANAATSANLSVEPTTDPENLGDSSTTDNEASLGLQPVDSSETTQNQQMGLAVEPTDGDETPPATDDQQQNDEIRLGVEEEERQQAQDRADAEYQEQQFEHEKVQAEEIQIAREEERVQTEAVEQAERQADDESFKTFRLELEADDVTAQAERATNESELIETAAKDELEKAEYKAFLLRKKAGYSSREEAALLEAQADSLIKRAKVGTAEAAQTKLVAQTASSQAGQIVENVRLQKERVEKAREAHESAREAAAASRERAAQVEEEAKTRPLPVEEKLQVQPEVEQPAPQQPSPPSQGNNAGQAKPGGPTVGTPQQPTLGVQPTQPGTSTGATTGSNGGATTPGTPATQMAAPAVQPRVTAPLPAPRPTAPSLAAARPTPAAAPTRRSSQAGPRKVVVRRLPAKALNRSRGLPRLAQLRSRVARKLPTPPSLPRISAVKSTVKAAQAQTSSLLARFKRRSVPEPLPAVVSKALQAIPASFGFAAQTKEKDPGKKTEATETSRPGTQSALPSASGALDKLKGLALSVFSPSKPEPKASSTSTKTETAAVQPLDTVKRWANNFWGGSKESQVPPQSHNRALPKTTSPPQNQERSWWNPLKYISGGGSGSKKASTTSKSTLASMANAALGFIPGFAPVGVAAGAAASLIKYPTQSRGPKTSSNSSSSGGLWGSVKNWASGIDWSKIKTTTSTKIGTTTVDWNKPKPSVSSGPGLLDTSSSPISTTSLFPDTQTSFSSDMQDKLKNISQRSAFGSSFGSSSGIEAQSVGQSVSLESLETSVFRDGAQTLENGTPRSGQLDQNGQPRQLTPEEAKQLQEKEQQQQGHSKKQIAQRQAEIKARKLSQRAKKADQKAQKAAAALKALKRKMELLNLQFAGREGSPEHRAAKAALQMEASSYQVELKTQLELSQQLSGELRMQQSLMSQLSTPEAKTTQTSQANNTESTRKTGPKEAKPKPRVAKPTEARREAQPVQAQESKPEAQKLGAEQEATPIKTEQLSEVTLRIDEAREQAFEADKEVEQAAFRMEQSQSQSSETSLPTPEVPALEEPVEAPVAKVVDEMLTPAAPVTLPELVSPSPPAEELTPPIAKAPDVEVKPLSAELLGALDKTMPEAPEAVRSTERSQKKPLPKPDAKQAPPKANKAEAPEIKLEPVPKIQAPAENNEAVQKARDEANEAEQRENEAQAALERKKLTEEFRAEAPAKSPKVEKPAQNEEGRSAALASSESVKPKPASPQLKMPVAGTKDQFAAVKPTTTKRVAEPSLPSADVQRATPPQIPRKSAKPAPPKPSESMKAEETAASPKQPVVAKEPVKKIAAPVEAEPIAKTEPVAAKPKPEAKPKPTAVKAKQVAKPEPLKIEEPPLPRAEVKPPAPVNPPEPVKAEIAKVVAPAPRREEPRPVVVEEKKTATSEKLSVVSESAELKKQQDAVAKSRLVESAESGQVERARQQALQAEETARKAKLEAEKRREEVKAEETAAPPKQPVVAEESVKKIAPPVKAEPIAKTKPVLAKPKPEAKPKPIVVEPKHVAKPEPPVLEEPPLPRAEVKPPAPVTPPEPVKAEIAKAVAPAPRKEEPRPVVVEEKKTATNEKLSVVSESAELKKQQDAVAKSRLVESAESGQIERARQQALQAEETARRAKLEAEKRRQEVKAEETAAPPKQPVVAKEPVKKIAPPVKAEPIAKTEPVLAKPKPEAEIKPKPIAVEPKQVAKPEPPVIVPKQVAKPEPLKIEEPPLPRAEVKPPAPVNPPEPVKAEIAKVVAPAPRKEDPRPVVVEEKKTATSEKLSVVSESAELKKQQDAVAKSRLVSAEKTAPKPKRVVEPEPLILEEPPLPRAEIQPPAPTKLPEPVKIKKVDEFKPVQPASQTPKNPEPSQLEKQMDAVIQRRLQPFESLPKEVTPLEAEITKPKPVAAPEPVQPAAEVLSVQTPLEPPKIPESNYVTRAKAETGPKIVRPIERAEGIRLDQIRREQQQKSEGVPDDGTGRSRYQVPTVSFGKSSSQSNAGQRRFKKVESRRAHSPQETAPDKIAPSTREQEKTYDPRERSIFVKQQQEKSRKETEESVLFEVRPKKEVEQQQLLRKQKLERSELPTPITVWEKTNTELDTEEEKLRAKERTILKKTLHELADDKVNIGRIKMNDDTSKVYVEVKDKKPQAKAKVQEIKQDFKEKTGRELVAEEEKPAKPEPPRPEPEFPVAKVVAPRAKPVSPEPVPEPEPAPEPIELKAPAPYEQSEPTPVKKAPVVYRRKKVTEVNPLAAEIKSAQEKSAPVTTEDSDTSVRKVRGRGRKGRTFRSSSKSGGSGGGGRTGKAPKFKPRKEKEVSKDEAGKRESETNRSGLETIQLDKDLELLVTRSDISQGAEDSQKEQGEQKNTTCSTCGTELPPAQAGNCPVCAQAGQEVLALSKTNYRFSGSKMFAAADTIVASEKAKSLIETREILPVANLKYWPKLPGHKEILQLRRQA